jgi:glycosyltransferase involved in cell wall biosynthesis
VVNEAMLCGCPVVASDKVGAVRDLIVPGKTGFVYRCGDIQALAGVLRQALGDREQLSAIRSAALARIEAWSPRASVAALVDAVARAVSGHRHAPARENESPAEPGTARKFSG